MKFLVFQSQKFELLKKNQLNGFESASEFYHLTNLETFKRLQDF